MLTTSITLSTMAALLEIKDPALYARPEGTFAWILLKATTTGGQTHLIIGDVKSHEDLFLFWRAIEGKDRGGPAPKTAWMIAKAKNSELREQFRPSVMASGVIDRKGDATSWESKWFVTKTPEGMENFMRDELIAAIRMYFPERGRLRTTVPHP